MIYEIISYMYSIDQMFRYFICTTNLFSFCNALICISFLNSFVFLVYFDVTKNKNDPRLVENFGSR